MPSTRGKTGKYEVALDGGVRAGVVNLDLQRRGVLTASQKAKQQAWRKNRSSSTQRADVRREIFCAAVCVRG